MSNEDKLCIDVHHHIVPKEYVQALKKHGILEKIDFELPEWTPEISLEAMDKHGIKAAVMSLSTPGVYFGDNSFAVDIARQCNEISASAVKQARDRFGFFASLPLPLIEESLNEINYAMDELNADGISLLASIDDLFLGDPSLDPVMNELNKRKAIVFVHPNTHSSSHCINPQVPNFVFEFLADTTRAILNLATQGVFEKYPCIKWIFAHAGGTIPYISWRFALCDYLPQFSDKMPRGVLSYLRNLYYDTALSSSPMAMASLEQITDPSHILFGSDFPFANDDLVSLQNQQLAQVPNMFTKTSLDMVKKSNPLYLFPQFK